MLEALSSSVGRHDEQGSAGHKKPPAGRTPPEGALTHAPLGHLPTRRAYEHGAVSIAALLITKDYCHTDRPTTKPWGFTLTTNFYICLAVA